MDLWGIEASVVGLVSDQDNQPLLHKETLSKNMNKTIKILKNRSHSMEEDNVRDTVLGQGLLELLGPQRDALLEEPLGSFGPEMKVASRHQCLYCDFFESRGTVSPASVAFSFETSGMVR